MKMVLAQVDERIEVPNVVEFVKHFKLEDDFKEEYKTDIDEWNFDICDEEVIEHLLSIKQEKYIVLYMDYNDGYFIILKLGK